MEGFFMPKNSRESNSPNLDFKSQTTSQDGKKRKIRAIKCSCKKSWCPICSKKTTIKRFSGRIKDWDWRYVRQVVLTVNYKLYEDPEQALMTINGKRHIAGLVRNLERTKGIKVIDWEWVLEWYKNGYPHWHLFLLVDKVGKAGQIGFKNIVQYWQSGWIKESYIKNERHWNRLTGYFEKSGYFDEKRAHQSKLPEWARNKKYVIRRIGGKAKKPEKKYGIDKLLKEIKAMNRSENPDKVRFDDLLKAIDLGIWFDKQGKEIEKLTEGEKLDLCGTQTDIYLKIGFRNYLGRVNIPYKQFRSMPGEYVEFQGYMIELDQNQFNDFKMMINKPGEGWSMENFINQKNN